MVSCVLRPWRFCHADSRSLEASRYRVGVTTPKSAARARENFDISALLEDALNEINRIQTRQRLNEVVKTGVPGFIAQGS